MPEGQASASINRVAPEDQGGNPTLFSSQNSPLSQHPSFAFFSRNCLHFSSVPMVFLHFHQFQVSFLSFSFRSFPCISSSVVFASLFLISVHLSSNLPSIRAVSHHPSLSFHFPAFQLISLHVPSFPFISIHLLSLHHVPSFCSFSPPPFLKPFVLHRPHALHHLHHFG